MGTTALFVAVAGAILASALLIFATFALLRVLRQNGLTNGPPPEPDVAPQPADQIAAPLDEERQQAFRHAQQEARRARQLATLAVTLELETLLTQVLEAAAAACRADAVAIRVLQEGGAAVIKTLNLQPGEDAPSLELLATESRARAVAMRY